jgi:hypothetical protein
MLNQTLYLQTMISRLYRERHNISLKEFIELDKKCGILKYLEIGYEPFHLTGTEGVLDEIEDYVNSQAAG